MSPSPLLWPPRVGPDAAELLSLLSSQGDCRQSSMDAVGVGHDVVELPSMPSSQGECCRFSVDVVGFGIAAVELLSMLSMSR